MKLASLAARALIGGLFVGHGLQKLTGAFDGPGLDGFAGMMESMSMHPPRRNALAAGLSETGGGALLAAGLLTPLASPWLTGTMLVAIAKVHASNGPWVTGGGWEYNAVLVARRAGDRRERSRPGVARPRARHRAVGPALGGAGRRRRCGRGLRHPRGREAGRPRLTTWPLSPPRWPLARVEVAPSARRDGCCFGYRATPATSAGDKGHLGARQRPPRPVVTAISAGGAGYSGR